MFKWPDKDPDAVLDFGFDWEPWLEGDTLADSDWIVPEGIAKDPDKGDTFTDTDTTIWLTGGTEGEKYEVTNRITTAAGRIDDRTAVVKIRSK
jgi:hypothetical protein